MSAKKKTKKTDKKANKKTEKRMTVQELINGLNYLHPQNKTTKNAYKLVVALQSRLDANTPEHLTGQYVASLTLSVGHMSICINDMVAWDSNVQSEDELNLDVILLNAREQIVHDAAVILGTKQVPEVLHEALALDSGEVTATEVCDSVEQPEGGDVDTNEPEERGDVEDRGYEEGYFIGCDAGGNTLNRFTELFASKKECKRVLVPNVDVANRYFIFYQTKDGDCDPLLRWTKKKRWKPIRKQDLLLPTTCNRP